MSATLRDVSDIVRAHLNDPYDGGKPVFSRSVIYAKIDNSLRGTIATALKLGETYSVGALTIGTSNNTYDLPAGVQYRYVRQAHLQSRGRDLEIVPYEAIAADLNNIIDPSNFKSFPMKCAMWEEPGQSVKIKFYPWPIQSDVVDFMQSVLPTKVSDDDDVIPLDDNGIAALGYDAAAELVAGANQEKLIALRLSPAVFQLYEQKRDKALRQSRLRFASLRAAGRTRQSRR